MSIWSMYRLSDGGFTGEVFEGAPCFLAQNTPPGCGAAQGRHGSGFAVDLATGEVVQRKPADDEWTRHVLQGGEWVATPTVAGLWRMVRARRTALLAGSDWIVTRAAERGETVPVEWMTYRQALRDITEQPDPEHIVWPTPP